MKTVLTVLLCSTLGLPVYARSGGSTSSPPRASSPVPSAGSRFSLPTPTPRAASPVPAAGSRFGTSPIPSAGSRLTPSPQTTRPNDSGPIGGSRSTGISNGNGNGGGGYRPMPIRTLNPAGRTVVITRGAAAPNLADPTHPLHPLNPPNPVAPSSPLNPINQMNLNDDDGNAVFEKVLKVENDAGTLRAYQCLVEKSEFDKADPMEQDCVLLGVVFADRIAELVDKKKSCGDIDGGDAFALGMIGILGATLGATGGVVTMAFVTDTFSLGRFVAVPAVATGVAASVIAYVAGVDICRTGISLMARRFLAEINHDVPPNFARLQKMPSSAWTALDAIIK